MMDYYDMILVLIPISIVGVAVALYGIGLSITIAAPLGALVAIGVMGHALFINAPVTRTASADAPSSQPAD